MPFILAERRRVLEAPAAKSRWQEYIDGLRGILVKEHWSRTTAYAQLERASVQNLWHRRNARGSLAEEHRLGRIYTDAMTKTLPRA